MLTQISLIALVAALAAALTLAAVFWVRWKLAERRARRAREWVPGPNARWRQKELRRWPELSPPPPVVYIVPAADLRNEACDVIGCECELWTSDLWQF